MGDWQAQQRQQLVEGARQLCGDEWPFGEGEPVRVEVGAPDGDGGIELRFVRGET